MIVVRMPPAPHVPLPELLPIAEIAKMKSLALDVEIVPEMLVTLEPVLATSTGKPDLESNGDTVLAPDTPNTVSAV